MSMESPPEASSSTEEDYENLDLSYPCPSPIPELAFTGKRDLDVPLSDSLKESLAPPKQARVFNVVTNKLFRIGMQFHHASGKSFIVCNDGVIREIVQDPSTTGASGSAKTNHGAVSGHAFKGFNFKPTAEVAPVSKNGADSTAKLT